MKLRHVLLAFLVSTACAEEGRTIIDTKFDIAAAFEKAGPPTAAGDLPLKAPSQISVTPPSVFEPGQKIVGDLKPPYALAKVEGRESNPEAPANLLVQWTLKDLTLEPGRYRVSFKVGVLEALTDAGNLAITLLDEKGTPIDLRRCPRVAFADGKIRSARQTNANVLFAPGDLHSIEMILDTEQLTWGSSVDGETLRDELPLDQDPADESKRASRIGGVSYFSVGGADSSRPGSSLAIFEVTMTRLK